MKKKFFIAACMLTVASISCFAKNVVPITTSCGEKAWIDTDRGTPQQTMEQIMAIDKVLCPENWQ